MLALLAGITGGCNPASSDDTVLQIGTYRLSRTEFESISQGATYKALTDEQLRMRLVEEGSILSYAREHGYDTIELLNRQLDYALRYYVSSVDGYLWNKKVKPLLQVSSEDIRKAQAMRTQEYQLESLYFPNEALVKKYCTANRPLATARDFYAVREKTKADPQVNFYRGFRRYPFFPLGVYLPSLAEARVGEVWGPIETLSGFFLVHVADKRAITPGPVEQEQQAIREELLLGLKEKYIRESQQQVLREMKPQLQEEAIAQIASKADVKERTWRGVDPDLLLMEYEFAGTHSRYKAADLMEFVQCQPMFSGSLSKPDDVKKMLHAHLVGISLFAQAQQMGMDTDSAYQQLKKRYQQGIFIQHFKQEQIYPKISIGEADLERYYQEHQKELNCFASAELLLYKYSNKQRAFEGRQLILDHHTHKMDGKGKPLPIGERVAVQVKDTLYSKAVIDAIARLGPGGISIPIEENGQHLVIYLVSKSGSGPTPYKYAKEGIRELLFSQQEQALITALEKVYPVKVDHIKTTLEQSKQ
ncbi:peptidyl-prolyl cis-trans isomerase [Paraflavitalea soli]|uniref:Peptidyl-prolyl cis-trans isomerase n=1 Tax=Paraflavitalea soli TaxID=2315862 RepID=A0A3B7MW18_9BACT|nr:peptidyl-prolyl cis-trans isomerase [Paraflavitalea soli]